MHLSPDADLAVRVEELKVRMMRMEDTQQQILTSIKSIETQLQSQQYQLYSPQDAYAQSYQYLPSYSRSVYPPPEQININGGVQPGLSSSPATLHSAYPPQMDDSTTSDPDMHSSVARNGTVYPCRVTLPPNASAPLPSSEIPKERLRDVQEILEGNAKLRTESTAGTLCQKLAKEAIFGKEVMKRCTPSGTREFPALPREELYELKLIMFRQYPRFHTCPGTFESLWKKCMISIEQACKRLRA